MKLSAKTRIGVVIAVLTMASISVSAQVVNSGAQTIALNASLSESVSLTLSANAVSFNLTAGSANNPGSTSVTATTTWTLRPNRGSLSVYAFLLTRLLL